MQLVLYPLFLRSLLSLEELANSLLLALPGVVERVWQVVSVVYLLVVHVQIRLIRFSSDIENPLSVSG